MVARRAYGVKGVREKLGRLVEDAHARAVVDMGGRVGFGAAALDRALGGGLAKGALHEARGGAARDLGAGLGFALGLAARAGGRLLWIVDPAARGDGGTPCPDGLTQYGLAPERLDLVTPRRLTEALWAAEEAAKCGDLAAVVVQLRGAPEAFDMVASRRLALRARASGALVLALRQGEAQAAPPNAAATRWRVAPTPSGEIEESDLQGANRLLGGPRFLLTLERNRHGPTGRWAVDWNPEAKAFEDVPRHRFPQAAKPSAHDGARAARPVLLHAAAFERPRRADALGRVMAHERAS